MVHTRSLFSLILQFYSSIQWINALLYSSLLLGFVYLFRFSWKPGRELTCMFADPCLIFCVTFNRKKKENWTRRISTITTLLSTRRRAQLFQPSRRPLRLLLRLQSQLPYLQSQLPRLTSKNQRAQMKRREQMCS